MQESEARRKMQSILILSILCHAFLVFYCFV